MRRGVLIGLVGLLAGAALWRPWTLLARQQSVKLAGCVERDAASSADAYKLIAEAEGRPRVYQLRAPREIDLKAALGKRVAVTGLLTREKTTGREVDVLSIQSLQIVADKCGELRQNPLEDLSRWAGEGGSIHN